MARPKTQVSRRSFGSSTWLLLMVAFALGAGVTWLFMRNPAPSPPAIESFLPGNAASPMTAAASAPDVSQLPPAEAARTLGELELRSAELDALRSSIISRRSRPGPTRRMSTPISETVFVFSGSRKGPSSSIEIAQKQDPRHENSLFNQISLFADYLHDPDRAAAAARDFVARFPHSPQAPAARQLSAQMQGKSGAASPPP